MASSNVGSSLYLLKEFLRRKGAKKFSFAKTKLFKRVLNQKREHELLKRKIESMNGREKDKDQMEEKGEKREKGVEKEDEKMQ